MLFTYQEENAQIYSNFRQLFVFEAFEFNLLTS